METVEYEAALQLKLKQWGEMEYGMPIKVLLTVLYTTILLLGIVGNSVTIKVTQVLQKKGYLQKNVTDHMVSLACSDLLVLLIGMPVELYVATWFPFSPYASNLLCKVYNFLFEVCSYATILNVATLSFERYIAICHPLKFQALSSTRTLRLIIFAWVTSVLVGFPLIHATGTERTENILNLSDQSSITREGGSMRNLSVVLNLTFCTDLPSKWTIYRTSIFAAFIVYIVVLVSVGFMCNSMINVLAGTQKNSQDTQDTKTQEILPKHESPQARESRKQTIVFLGLIVGTVTGCWMPNQIRRLMTAAKAKPDWTLTYLRVYAALHPIADTFFYLSSVVNPFLYNFSSRQFREVFAQVLRGRLTIEHINKRNLRRPDTRSARQLILRSLRRGLPAHGRDRAKGTPSPINLPSSPSLSTTHQGDKTSESDF